MTEYLGICMVVIVITLCIGILSTIVTENILKQFEAHKRRVSDRRWAQFDKYLISIRVRFKDELDKIIEAMEKDKNRQKVKDLADALDKQAKDLEVD